MDLIYLYKKNNIKYKITKKKFIDNCKNLNKIYLEYYNLFCKIENTSTDIINKYYSSIRFFSFMDINNSKIFKYLMNILNIDKYYITDVDGIDSIKDIKNLENNKYIYVCRNDNTKPNTIQNDGYEIYHNCKYSNIFYKVYLNWLKNIFKILKNGDNISFYFIIYQNNDNLINLFYILGLIFDKVFLVNSKYVWCLNFNDKSEYIKYIIDYDDSKNIFLNIEPKPDLDKLLNYMDNIFLSNIKMFNILLNQKEDKLFIEMFNFYTSFAKDSFIKEYDKNNLYHIYLNKFFIESYRRLFITKNNSYMKKNNNIEEIKIHSAIKKEEGNTIQNIINKYKLEKCLEIGMAFGISAFYILTSNKNVSLTSIDPFQKDPTQWKSMGLKLIKKMNLNNRHNFISELSYISLPKLLSTYGSSYYDFIFIDGWHTFDYTLIDFFYADKLLRKNGIIIIDDALHEGVKKFVRYIETNYKNYKKIDIYKTQAGFQKLKEDSREWFFHSGF
jgi:predicted O-methyltransferase YrrM